jgi:HK97 family phage major capsid protein
MHLTLLALMLLPLVAFGAQLHGTRALRPTLTLRGFARAIATFDHGDITNVPEELKGKSADDLRSIVDYLGECLRGLHEGPDGELRSLDETEQTSFDAGLALRAAAVQLLERHDQIAKLADAPAKVERSAPSIIRSEDPMEVFADRSATPSQLADALTRSLEGNVEDAENMAHVRKVVKRMLPRNSRNEDREWARGLIARASDEYTDAWWKIINGREYSLTAEERTALGVVTNANGAFLLPTHLDPTIILTNSGSSNIIRSVARVVELKEGYTSWNGITSAGVTASWDGEVVEVSDDSPTVGKPNIGVIRAQAFVEASISATEDISGLAEDVMMMFADARDRLEGAAHAVGNGTTAPKGIFTALNADTNVQITSTTAATIGLVDVHALYKAVPVRWRKKSTWCLNPTYNLAIKALGTALSASYSTDLTQEPSDRILNRPVLESDDAPSTQTTTALDNEVILGDFSNFVIVDKPGSMSVEYIPHLFNTANNLPDGRRGWFATWRNGSDVVTTSPFRMLVDKTSA